jgi:hypothetical protein
VEILARHAIHWMPITDGTLQDKYLSVYQEDMSYKEQSSDPKLLKAGNSLPTDGNKEI